MAGDAACSSAAPDSAFAFVGGPCCPTLEFVIVFWIMITFYTMLTSLFCIILLQETHFIEKNESIYNSCWFGKSYHCFSDSQYSRGVSILFRKNLPIHVINVHKSIDGRRILINFQYDDKKITIVNAYAPNNVKERIDFFKRVKTWTNQLTCNKENILIAGDMNCTLDNITKNTDRSSHTLKKLLDDLDLIDLWPNFKTDPGFTCTWCDGMNTPK